MKSGKTTDTIAIPEWKQCYLNYQTLKNFIIIISQIRKLVEYCEKIKKEMGKDSEHSNEDSSNLLPRENAQLNRIRGQLIELANSQNRIFYKIYACQAHIAQLFYQMKIHQIEEKYRRCLLIKQRQLSKSQLPLFYTYIEYVYLQVQYISQMREVNIDVNSRILKKHKKKGAGMVETPQSRFNKIIRMCNFLPDYNNKLQDLYALVNRDKSSQEAKMLLRKTANKLKTNFMDYFLLGFGIGATLILLTTFIYIINFENLSIEDTSEQFALDFPTWRGIALFICYIWVLGFDVYCFEKYKISHKIIFKFDDHHYSTSWQIYKVAGIFTTIYMIIFLLYVLIQSGIIRDSILFSSKYYALIIWLVVAFYLFMPFKIFNYKGRLYALKLIFSALTSPLLYTDFTVNWMTDQWTSMLTPLNDLIYTVCYYWNFDSQDNGRNVCKNHQYPFLNLLPIFIICTYKILKSINKGLSQGKYLLTTNMLESLLYTFTIVIASISLISSSQFTNWFFIWIFFSIIQTGMSYYWDVVFDWDLFVIDKNNKLALRKYLTFLPKTNYYLIIGADLIMRISWSITLSTTVSTFFGSSALLMLITGLIEIIRRGIWNLLSVEKEHLINCDQFKAVPDMDYLERMLKQEQEKYQQQSQRTKIQKQIEKSYISLIKQKIIKKQILETNYTKKYKQEKLSQINNFRKEIQEIEKNG